MKEGGPGMAGRRFDVRYSLGFAVSHPDHVLAVHWFIKGAPPGSDGSLRTA